MDVFFSVFTVFQTAPLVALVPAAVVLFLLFRNSGGEQAKGLTVLGVVTGGLWAAYALWEYRVQLWAENESAPIRIDLLAIYPLLTILTAWFLLRVWRSSRS